MHLVEARRCHGDAQQPVSQDYAAPARGKQEGMEQAARANVVCLGVLAPLTQPDVALGVDFARLPLQVGKPSDLAAVLWLLKCPPRGFSTTT